MKKNNFNYYEIKKYYPNIETDIKFYTLTELKTFKELKIKKESDAFNAGALQLKPYSNNGSYSIASLWVHPSDKEAYFGFEKTILDNRKKEEKKDKLLRSKCEVLARDNDLCGFEEDIFKYIKSKVKRLTDSKKSEIIAHFIKSKKNKENREINKEKSRINIIASFVKDNESKVLECEKENWSKIIKSAKDINNCKQLSKRFFKKKTAYIHKLTIVNYLEKNYPDLMTVDLFVNLLKNPASISANPKHKNSIQKKINLYLENEKSLKFKEDIKIIVSNLEDHHKIMFNDDVIKKLIYNPCNLENSTPKDIVGELIESEKRVINKLEDFRAKATELGLDFENFSVDHVRNERLNLSDFMEAIKQIQSYGITLDFISLNPSFQYDRIVKMVKMIQLDTKSKLVLVNIKKSNKLRIEHTLNFENVKCTVLSNYSDNLYFSTNELLYSFIKIAKFLRNRSDDYENINNVFQKDMIRFSEAVNSGLKENRRIHNQLISKKKNISDVYEIKEISGKFKSVQKVELLDIAKKFNNKFKNIEDAKYLLPSFPDIKNLYVKARKKQRKFTFFAGETNSGKTYSAFNEMVKHNSGIYLSPLRLLALEGQEEIEKRGKLCSYLTGEESELKEDAKFICSTIEMLNINREYDCAIIDEVQMLKDSNRGSNWLEAILGVNAEHVILTGTIAALPVVEKLIKYTGDTLEVIKLEKKTSLEFRKSVNISDIPDNSAIIAFSKKEIHRIRKYLKQSSSVIYGALSPEVRRSEAEKFRSGDTKVLLSTDAIGMGLNLPIESIFFSGIEKYNGNYFAPLESEEILQISGRAGRFNLFEKGYVGFVETHNFYANKSESESLIKDALNKKVSQDITDCHLSLSRNMFRSLSELLETEDVSRIINFYSKFMDSVVNSGVFKLHNGPDFRERSLFVANYLKDNKCKLEFEDNIGLLFLPLDISKKKHETMMILNILMKKIRGENSNSVGFMNTKRINKLDNSLYSIECLEKDIYMCDLLHNIEKGYDLKMTNQDYEGHKKACEKIMAKIIAIQTIAANCSVCKSPIKLGRHAMCNDCFRHDCGW